MIEQLLKQAITNCNLVNVTVKSFEKGTIIRVCIPFDIGPSRKYKDGKVRYHFYDLNSPDGIHNLSILPEQLTNIEILQDKFDPLNYVTWIPNWFYKRDWGKCS